mgnify:CR=1 FL=1
MPRGAPLLDVQINIFEVKRPELDAQIVAANIARQIEGKIAYRRAVKMAVQSTMRSGAEGIKVQVSGRLNGAEMARLPIIRPGREVQIVMVMSLSVRSITMRGRRYQGAGQRPS